MQSRVVGQMQSWRGLRRRVGRVTPGRLAVPGIVPKLSAGPSGLTDAEDDHDQANRVGGGGIVRAESGSGGAMTDDAEEGERQGRGTGGAGEEERIARGTGVQEQSARGEGVREQNRGSAPGSGGVDTAGAGRVGTPEQALVSMPERRVSLPEHSLVPGWLQTGAAWSWRLLLLAVALYLIARILGVLYIVAVPCIAALLLTALLQPLTARLRRAGLPGLAAP